MRSSMLMKSCAPLFPLAAISLAVCRSGLFAADPPRPSFAQVRLVAPDLLQRGMRNLVHVEGLVDGKTWKPLDPGQFTVTVTGAAHLADDPAGRPMNPFEVRCDDAAQGKVTVEVRAADRRAARTFAIGTAKPAGVLQLT